MGVVTGGGGGTFDGGTITQRLTSNTTNATAYRVRNPSDPGAEIDVGIADLGGGAASPNIELDATLGGESYLRLRNAFAGSDIHLGSQSFNYSSGSNVATDQLWSISSSFWGTLLTITSANTQVSAPMYFLAGSPPTLQNTSAPTNGSLAAGDCALWFDQTDGAAKLMVKAKSANGTVVSAAIALT